MGELEGRKKRGGTVHRKFARGPHLAVGWYPLLWNPPSAAAFERTAKLAPKLFLLPHLFLLRLLMQAVFFFVFFNLFLTSCLSVRLHSMWFTHSQVSELVSLPSLEACRTLRRSSLLGRTDYLDCLSI